MSNTCAFFREKENAGPGGSEYVQDCEKRPTSAIKLTMLSLTKRSEDSKGGPCMSFAGRIFMENAAGTAVASLGQIVEGYVVVFGREDGISLRSLEEAARGDFLNLVRTARQRVEQRFGPTVLFEHGPSFAGTDVSCGVNRMHLHIVPYAGRSLKNEI